MHASWSRLHIDFAGFFKEQVFLILVNAFSKWFKVVPVSLITSATVIKAIQHLFATHGLPDAVVSDNTAQFTFQEFQKFLENDCIHHIMLVPFHPSANGQVECMVRYTKDSLRK